MTLTVDLYQAKHHQQYPCEIWKWAWSLGISGPFDSPSSSNKSAQYSDLGIEFFVSYLKKQRKDSGVTGVKKTIRNRILVVSETREKTDWVADFFEAAHQSGLKIWTRENMEPTFSAITSGDVGMLDTTES